MTDAEHRPGALLLTRNLPPLRGGMERLNAHMAQALSQHFALGVCGPIGCRAELPRGAEVREHPARLLRFLPGCLFSALSLARRLRPDVVVAGSGLTAPIALLAARWFGARAVAFAHGLDLVVRSRVYRALWLPCLRRLDLVLVNSANTRALAMERGIPADRLAVLHPGTAVPGHDEEAGRAFRAETGLTDQPLLLSVGRLTPRKGLAEFVRGVLPRIVAERPGTTLLVIGADARDALTHRTGSEQARIERAAQEAGVETAIRWMPPCDDATLARAYQAADVHVFPVRETPGDVEGFGMVAIEAAAHGTPTVAYAVGGVPDAVVEGRSGTLVSAGDEAAFARAVVELIGPTTRGSWRDRCVEAASAFAWDRFNTRLIDLIRGPLETPA